MFDVDKFIECVRLNPAIWDMGSEDYQDRSVRNDSWFIIGKMMNSGWPDMTHEEKEEQVKEMKNKWRHIRDNYFKHTTQVKSARKKKRYIYATYLGFLDQTAGKRKTRYSTAEGEEETAERVPSQEEGVVSEVGEGSIVPEITNVSSLQTFNRSQEFDQPTVEHRLFMDDDADKAFLLSLLPDYKQLSYEQKIDFRIHALQFFRDIVRRGK